MKYTVLIPSDNHQSSLSAPAQAVHVGSWVSGLW